MHQECSRVRLGEAVLPKQVLEVEVSRASSGGHARTLPPLFLTAASHFGAKSHFTLVQLAHYFHGLLKVRIKNLFKRGKSPPPFFYLLLLKISALSPAALIKRCLQQSLQTILVQQRRCWSCGRRTP